MLETERSISSRKFDPRSDLVFFCVPFFRTSILFGAVWFHSQVSLGPILLCILMNDACMYIPGIYQSIQSAAAAAAALCVAILLSLLLQQLLLAASVRHGVLDGKICCWFNESGPSVFFSSFKHDFQCTLWHYHWCCIYGLDLPYTTSTSSAITHYGHARSQGGRQPTAAKISPLNSYLVQAVLVVSYFIKQVDKHEGPFLTKRITSQFVTFEHKHHDS